MSKQIIGGFLSGLGRGIVAEAEERREDANRRREEAMRRAESQAERRWRSEEFRLDREARASEAGARRDFDAQQGALDREARGSEVVDVVTSPSGDVSTLTRDGDVNPQDLQSALPENQQGPGYPGRDDTPSLELTASEQRVLTSIEEQYTNPATKAVDRTKVIAHLRELGNPRMTEIADMLAGAPGAAMNASDALDAATSEANQRAGIFSDGFGDDESRDEFIERRSGEIRSAAPSGGIESDERAVEIREQLRRGEIGIDQARRRLRMLGYGEG